MEGSAFRVSLRSMTSPDVAAYEGPGPIEALVAALSIEPEDESFVFWDSIESLAALDLDVEEGMGWDHCRLLVLLDTFRPTPSLSWVTHGGGLRMIFTCNETYTASEIAAVAALNLLNSVVCEGVELKKETRHPKCTDSRGHRGGEVAVRKQVFDASSLRQYLGVREADDDAVSDWLAARGLAVGCRYDHDKCPVAPSERGSRKPVVVGEKGIKCFVCEGSGVTAGSSMPGFFPYTFLCGTSRATLLKRCLENATHWEHARFILDEVTKLPESFARLVYAAGVTMFRGRKDSDRCFSVENIVRIGDTWTNLNGEPYSKDIKPLLSCLPACTYRDAEGSVKVDRARVVQFEQAFDLEKYGYPSLFPVFGCRMWEGNGDGRVRAVIQTRELGQDSHAQYRPMYVSPARRMPEAEMWAAFEEGLPGLDRQLLSLLVSARGIAEGCASMPPMVFITGPTGAGKSQTVFLASSVCGDRNTEIVWVPDTVRIRQAVIEASSVGTYVTFNEVLKEARHHKGGGAMDYILNLTPDSVSHVMYIGPVRLGRLPVFVWTDTELTPEISADAQLARRIVHVHLKSQVDWERPLKDSGVMHPRRFRVSSRERAEACNALLSSLVDRFFRPPRTFEEIAEALGYKRVSKSERAEERGDELRTLFDAVCSAPLVSGSDAIRWKGRGWVVLCRDVTTPLREAWEALADADDFTRSRAVSEVDWQSIAGLKEPSTLEVRSHGTKVALRFRSVEGTRSEYRVNGELR